MVSSISHTTTTNVDVATAKDTTSITKVILGTKPSSSLDDLKRWMALIDNVETDMRAVIGIASVLPDPPPPPTEEEQLQQFIKDYIDEPPPTPKWKSLMHKMMAYTQMYSGRGMSKSKLIGYHNHVIIDDFCTPHEKPTFKPTKKQANIIIDWNNLYIKAQFKCRIKSADAYLL